MTRLRPGLRPILLGAGYVGLAVMMSPAFLRAGAESVGTTSANFLKILPPARAAAMGEAYTALSDDEGGLSYNPAGLANSLQDEISATHMEWFQGIRLEHVGGIFTLGGMGKVGVFVTSLQAGSQVRTERSGLSSADVRQNFNVLGEFSPYDNVVGVGLAQSFGRHLSLGTNLKVVEQAIDSHLGFGFNFDFGGHYDGLVEDLDLGLATHNLGTQIEVGSQGSAEPFTLNAGLRYGLLEQSLNLLLECVVPLDNSLEYSGGVEYWVARPLALRAGYKAGYFNQFTAGMGLDVYGLRLDYAFVPYADLGITQRLTATYAFGGPVVELECKPRLLAPNGDLPFQLARFYPLQVPKPSRLRSWKLELRDPEGHLVLTQRGGALVPDEMPWDGRDSKVLMLPDSAYQGRLILTYAGGVEARSGRVDVELDNTPPAIELEGGGPVEREASGRLRPVTFTATLLDLHDIGAWRLEILSDDGTVFRTLSGSAQVMDAIVWDGLGDDGSQALEGKTYKTVLRAKDSLGNWNQTQPVEAPVQGLIRMSLPSDVLFASGEALIRQDRREEFRAIVDKIRSMGQIVTSVEVVGHTDSHRVRRLYRDNQELSEVRAQAVAAYMARVFDLNPRLFTTSGKGASEPVAGNETAAGRARNRRVEIIIHTTGKP